VGEDLCADAIRLGRLLVELLPDEPEVTGLLALMLLVESRRASRTTPEGTLVLLADQDRAHWDRDLIAERQALVRWCRRRNEPRPYQVQAAINAVHSDAPTAADTDWRQVLQLYDQQMALAPGPVVALNRAVAVAEVEGPAAALAIVDALPLGAYYPVPRDPRGPAQPPGARRRVGGGLRGGDRAEREHAGARVPLASVGVAGSGATQWPTLM
jgi:RNA polymerase sigma-70 factor (ECF subfamily)